MGNEEKYYPLRPMQRWLINTHLAGNINSTMMNISKLLKLDQSIDMERLANSIYRVLNIYDIFRCRFALHPETGEICQKFDGEIDKIFVEHMSDKEFAEKIKTLKKPYHIIGNQLYRIRLIETPTTKYLYLDFYHAIMDGVAIAILFWHKFDAFYRGGYCNSTELCRIHFGRTENIT